MQVCTRDKKNNCFKKGKLLNCFSSQHIVRLHATVLKLQDLKIRKNKIKTIKISINKVNVENGLQ